MELFIEYIARFLAEKKIKTSFLLFTQKLSKP